MSQELQLTTCIQLRMTKHPSRKVMNFRHLLGCDTKVLCWFCVFYILKHLKVKKTRSVHIYCMGLTSFGFVSFFYIHSLRTDHALASYLLITFISFGLQVGLYHRPNKINEMNNSRGRRYFESPLKLERGHIETSNLVIMYIII